MDFGMPFLIENETVEDCIALCSKLGLQFVELGLNFPQCQLQNLNVNMLLEAKEKHSIYFTIHLDEPFNVCDFNPRISQAYTDTAVDAIRLSKRIGAPIINMHLAKGILITLPDKKVPLFEQYKDFYLDSLRRFRDICEQETDEVVKIAIENTNGFRLLHMHAHDARNTSNHLSFGDGEIDITSRLAWAKQENSRVVLEVKTISSLTETVSKLKDYL